MGIFADINNFFSKEAGQLRRQAIEDFSQKYIDDPLDYYLGPTGIPDRLRAVNELLNPIIPLEDASVSFQEGDIVGGLTNTALAALPVAGAVALRPILKQMPNAAKILSDSASRTVQDTLTGFSMGASGAARGAIDFADSLEFDPSVTSSFGAGSVRKKPKADTVEDILKNTPLKKVQNDLAEGGNFGALASLVQRYKNTGDTFVDQARVVDSVEGATPSGPLGSAYSSQAVHGRDFLKDFEAGGFNINNVNAPRVETDFGWAEGMTLNPVVGDRTARRVVTDVNGEVLETPVDMSAGAEFMDTPYAWASAQGAMTGKYNAMKADENPLLGFMAMGEQSGDFAKHTGNLVTEMFKTAKISKKNADLLSDFITSTTIKKKVKGKPTVRTPFADFKKGGVSDPQYVQDYFNSLPSGASRAEFVKRLDSKAAKDLGAPNIAAARMATTNPDLVSTDWMNTGYRFSQPNMDQGLIPSGGMHQTYDTMIARKPGTDTVTMDTGGIPYTLMYRDVADARRNTSGGKYGNIVPTTADYKSFEGNPSNKSFINAQRVDEVSKFMQIERDQGREAAIKYAIDMTRK